MKKGSDEKLKISSIGHIAFDSYHKLIFKPFIIPAKKLRNKQRYTIKFCENAFRTLYFSCTKSVYTKFNCASLFIWGMNLFAGMINHLKINLQLLSKAISKPTWI